MAEVKTQTALLLTRTPVTVIETCPQASSAHLINGMGVVIC